jgi:hypothetical protein
VLNNARERASRTSNGPTEAINGRLEHLRGSAGGLGTREENREISHQSGFHRGRTQSVWRLMAKLIGVSDHRLAAIQRADLAHLFLGQLEVEDVDVLGHPT